MNEITCSATTLHAISQSKHPRKIKRTMLSTVSRENFYFSIFFFFLCHFVSLLKTGELERVFLPI